MTRRRYRTGVEFAVFSALAWLTHAIAFERSCGLQPDHSGSKVHRGSVQTPQRRHIRHCAMHKVTLNRKEMKHVGTDHGLLRYAFRPDAAQSYGQARIPHPAVHAFSAF
jgi:hypothetical protein